MLRNKGKNFVLYFFPFLLTGCIREINLSRYQDERYPKEQKSLNQARRIPENCKLIKLFKAKLFHICSKLKECTVGWRYEKLIRLSKVLKGPNGKINSPDNNGHGEREMKRSGKIF